MWVAQDLAAKELLARDRQARETLALLDPSLQSALEVNEEVAGVILTAQELAGSRFRLQYFHGSFPL